MGLLDEAIRDHLELKRRRGGDPSEIALAERDALDPIFPPEGREAASATGDAVLDAPGEPGEPPSAVSFADQDGAGAGELERLVDADPGPAIDGAPETPPVEPHFGAASVGQETAELDMRTVLGQDGDAAAAPGALDATPPEGERFEWEMPAAARTPASDGAHDGDGTAPGADTEDGQGGEIPGQERISFE